MEGKITLITPPDFFENESKSVLFMHLSDSDQEAVSKWLAGATLNENINIYFYDHEIEIPWLLHALARCEYKFVDLNNASYSTDVLTGHLLSKRDTFYKIDNENISSVCHYLNQNRISNVQTFLEKAFDVQR